MFASHAGNQVSQKSKAITSPVELTVQEIRSHQQLQAHLWRDFEILDIFLIPVLVIIVKVLGDFLENETTIENAISPPAETKKRKQIRSQWRRSEDATSNSDQLRPQMEPESRLETEDL